MKERPLIWDGRELALHCWMRNLRVASVSRMPSVAQVNLIGNTERLLDRQHPITGQRVDMSRRELVGCYPT